MVISQKYYPERFGYITSNQCNCLPLYLQPKDSPRFCDVWTSLNHHVSSCFIKKDQNLLILQPAFNWFFDHPFALVHHGSPLNLGEVTSPARPWATWWSEPWPVALRSRRTPHLEPFETSEMGLNQQIYIYRISWYRPNSYAQVHEILTKHGVNNNVLLLKG